jgi:hypothetical protein
MAQKIELGLGTFGDVTARPDGQSLPQAQVIRDVVEEASLADDVGVYAIGLGEHHQGVPLKALKFSPDLGPCPRLCLAAASPARLSLGWGWIWPAENGAPAGYGWPGAGPSTRSEHVE